MYLIEYVVLFILCMGVLFFVYAIIDIIKNKVRGKEEIDTNTYQLEKIQNDHGHVYIWHYKDDKNTWMIGNLFIDKKYRKKGYGTDLIQQAENIIKNKKGKIIFIKVKTLGWKKKWYKKLGYNSIFNYVGLSYMWVYKNI